MLVFFLVRAVGGILGREIKETVIFSFCVAILWLVHPIHITSVLYVIQRMTSLAATFGLISCLIYMKLISRLVIDSRDPSYLELAAVWFFLGLSILSKENGILFSGYLLCIEFLIKGKYQAGRRMLLLRISACYLPLLMLAGYFIVTHEHVLENYEIRQFSLMERLMTETRVLWTYVSAILLPSFGKYGLFYDDYVISRGLLNPVTTLLSIVSWSAIVGSFFIARIPRLFKFCLLWFLVGHALESTFIALEIYFEHRNYVPSVGLIVLFIAFFYRITVGVSVKYVRLASYGIPSLFFINSVIITISDVRLWAMPLKQAHVWTDEHLFSYRAREILVNRLFLAERYEQVNEQLNYISQKWPEKGRTYLDLVALSCYSNVSRPPLSSIEPALIKAELDSSDLEVLRGLVFSRIQGNCDAVDGEYLQKLLSLTLQSKSLGEHNYLPLLMKGQLYYHEGKYQRGKESFSQAYAKAPEDKLVVLLAHAVLLANHGFKEDAKVMLIKMKESEQWHKFSRGPIVSSTLSDIKAIISNNSKNDDGKTAES